MVAKMHTPEIPFILQEQNSFPGLTTRWFAKYASLICTAFEIFKDIDNNKLVITGNPIRNNICTGNNELAIKKILIFQKIEKQYLFLEEVKAQDF